MFRPELLHCGEKQALERSCDFPNVSAFKVGPRVAFDRLESIEYAGYVGNGNKFRNRPQRSRGDLSRGSEDIAHQLCYFLRPERFPIKLRDDHGAKPKRGIIPVKEALAINFANRSLSIGAEPEQRQHGVHPFREGRFPARYHGRQIVFHRR